MYQQDYAGAARTLRQLVQQLDAKRPLAPAAQQVRQQALTQLGAVERLYLRDYTQAVADYGRVARLHPHTGAACDALGAMGAIYQDHLDKPAEAIAAYTQLVADCADSPQAPTAQLRVAQAYLKLQDYAQAQDAANAVIARWPDSPEALRAAFEVADSFARQRQFIQAQAAYRTLLQQPAAAILAPWVYFELGNCYQELGEPLQALQAYYSALPQHPNPVLVQHKIARVRSRIYNLAPSEHILNAQPPSRRMLALQQRRQAHSAPRPRGLPR
jgi:tetratricopeptide (TPR) repeat protein